MSDTTITPEERAKWRALVMPYPDGTIGNQDKRMLHLLNAIEQAEAEVARLQQRVNELLSEELTDYAVRERIQLRLNMHEVLQQNERLTKMVDWLAQRCAMHCHDKDRDDILCSNDTCDIQTCWGASGDEWERSTRRAVAAGEG